MRYMARGLIDVKTLKSRTETFPARSRPLKVGYCISERHAWVECKMKRFRCLSSVGLALVLGIAAITNGAVPQKTTGRADATPMHEVQIPIQQFTLKNGLRVV